MKWFVFMNSGIRLGRECCSVYWLISMLCSITRAQAEPYLTVSESIYYTTHSQCQARRILTTLGGHFLLRQTSQPLTTLIDLFIDRNLWHRTERTETQFACL
ncbi:hypothetical protein BC827DRAFT_1190603 [Russula dissimulans]|nr:hypothetical protein BC827DRAFT_1190603 [Russula dissimulans]